jgi:hypothetical protein
MQELGDGKEEAWPIGTHLKKDVYFECQAHKCTTTVTTVTNTVPTLCYAYQFQTRYEGEALCIETLMRANLPCDDG